jgi:hypothetical protein
MEGRPDADQATDCDTASPQQHVDADRFLLLSIRL